MTNILQYGTIMPRNSKCLPRVVNKAINIGLPRLGSGYPVDGFKGCNNGSVVHKMKGWSSHLTVFFNQSFQPQFEFSSVQRCHFLVNPWKNNVRNGIKNPLFNAVTGCENEGLYGRTGGKPEAQFADKIAGCNDLRGKSHGVRVHVLNDNCKGFPARKGQDSIINRTGRFIKTMPNTLIE